MKSEEAEVDMGCMKMEGMPEEEDISMGDPEFF